jgi:hypothetical protein
LSNWTMKEIQYGDCDCPAKIRIFWLQHCSSH